MFDGHGKLIIIINSQASRAAPFVSSSKLQVKQNISKRTLKLGKEIGEYINTTQKCKHAITHNVNSY